MSEDVVQGVVVNPGLGEETRANSPEDRNIVPGDFMEIIDYDTLKEKGRSLGTKAGELVWTKEGRIKSEKILESVRSQIENTTVKTFFNRKNVNDGQVLYEVDSGRLGSSDQDLNETRTNLARARNLVSGQFPILSTDNFRGNNFQRAVLEKSIKDGWQETVEKSEFKNEIKLPWYLVKTDPSAPLLPARKFV